MTAAAVKAVLAAQLAAEMKKKRTTKKRMAELMNTSRAQVDRVLDPDNGATCAWSDEIDVASSRQGK